MTFSEWEKLIVGMGKGHSHDGNNSFPETHSLALARKSHFIFIARWEKLIVGMAKVSPKMEKLIPGNSFSGAGQEK